MKQLETHMKKVAAIFVFLWIVLPDLGSSAEPKSDLRITYSPPRISVEAQGVRLLQVLRDISVKVGFDVTDYGIPDRDLTVSIQEATMEEVLRQLLRGENYGFVYREKDGAISELLLLSPPIYAKVAPMSENPKTSRQAQKLSAARKDSRFFLPPHLINRRDRNESGKTDPRMRQRLRTSCECMRSRAWRDRVLFHRARRRTRLNR
jgi:hypothetical protein